MGQGVGGVSGNHANKFSKSTNTNGLVEKEYPMKLRQKRERGKYRNLNPVLLS